MNDKSHYLDNLIKQWDESSKKDDETKKEYIVSNIEDFKKGWDHKKLKDKVLLPMLSLYFFISLFTGSTLGEKLVSILPFLAVTLITFLQIRTNNKVDSIDLSLGVSDYRDKRFKILSGELKQLKRCRFLMYPAFFIQYLYKFLYVYDYDIKKTLLLFIVTIVGVTFMVMVLELGISHLKDKIRDLE